MNRTLSVDSCIDRLKQIPFTDKRKGKNTSYKVSDTVRAAFAVFFMQCPSFLEGQRQLEQARGSSNAASVFGIERLPSDAQIRNLLDEVSPHELSGEFRFLLYELERTGYLDWFRVLDNRLAFSLDGVNYFGSQEICCKHCQTQTLPNGNTLYKHAALTPVIVNPKLQQVLSYVPEFILPQDGHEKQDCENMAAKRWLEREKETLQHLRAVIMGDGLYSSQPLCQAVLDAGLDFLFVCKPDSHRFLYETVAMAEGLGRVRVVRERVWNGRHGEIHTWRYVNGMPLNKDEESLNVNWLELSIVHEQTGKQLFFNSWVTSIKVEQDNVVELAACGRARWKSENENNNVLKNHGYHLEHNFGHGKNQLSMTLVTLNLLSFFLHTIAEVGDALYRQIRRALGPRRRFFQDVNALLRYLLFESWSGLLEFMFVQLKLVPD